MYEVSNLMPRKSKDYQRQTYEWISELFHELDHFRWLELCVVILGGIDCRDEFLENIMDDFVFLSFTRKVHLLVEEGKYDEFLFDIEYCESRVRAHQEHKLTSLS